MLALNQYLFLLLNAPAHPDAATVALAEVAASGVIVLVPLLLAALWIWGDPAHRAGLVATAIASALALGANQILGLLWYEPRPFMVGFGHTLVTHAPDNSFPSDHTTFMLTVGLGLVATRAAPSWGKAAILMSVLVAWARIYLGLHFPVDMIASAFVGITFSGIAILVMPPVCRWIIPWAEILYEGAIRVLHLPPGFFPRRS